jgi:hypothetical protein
MAEKIQPMVLPGQWATITAPTAMNAAKASSRLLSCSKWKLPLATDRGTPTPSTATKTASMDQATQVQRLRTVSPRLLWSRRTVSAKLASVVGHVSSPRRSLRADRPEIVTSGATAANRPTGSFTVKTPRRRTTSWRVSCPTSSPCPEICQKLRYT